MPFTQATGFLRDTVPRLGGPVKALQSSSFHKYLLSTNLYQALFWTPEAERSVMNMVPALLKCVVLVGRQGIQCPRGQTNLRVMPAVKQEVAKGVQRWRPGSGCQAGSSPETEAGEKHSTGSKNKGPEARASWANVAMAE